jgi:hypothetical protein
VDALSQLGADPIALAVTPIIAVAIKLVGRLGAMSRAISGRGTSHSYWKRRSKGHKVMVFGAQAYETDASAPSTGRAGTA